MKGFMKKISLAVCTAAISVMFVTANVSAVVTPRPVQGGTTATDVVSETGTAAKKTKAKAEETETAQSMVQTSVNATANKKSFTNWNAFFWFLLSVAVNFVVSCWVGNKFYRLARKNTQTSNEIRALRKDIEEKFASTLNDIEDPAVEIMNRNENYARTDEGISMPEHRNRIEMNDEERETMRKWDERRITQRVAAREEAEIDEEKNDEVYEDAPVRRAYQPTRRSSGIEFEDEEYDDEVNTENINERESKKGAFSKATNKAKDFLSNVFPFED